MPVSAIDATPGSATANAYCTLAVADQYHLDRPPSGTTWENASEDEKIAAILWATKLLDMYFIWYGQVVDDVQILLWPRYGLVDVNRWSLVDETTIPRQIQWATAEYARQLLASDRAGDSAIQSLGLKLLKVSTIRMDFKDTVFAKPVPDVIVSMIPAHWGRLRWNGEIELQR